MSAKSKIVVGSLALFVACAAQQKSPGLQQYEQARADSYADTVRERFPDLFQEAEVHHAKATEAYNAKEEEAMNHHANVALLWWEAAKTRSEAVDLAEKASAVQSDFDAAQTELAAAEKRKTDAEAAVKRLEEIVALSGKLGDSEKSNAARKAINDALAVMKEAEAVNARTHAQQKFDEAESKFKAATTALEGGKLADAQSLAIESKAAAEAAKAASKDKFDAEQAKLAYEARRRAVFDASAKVSGAERAITEGGVLLTIRQVFPSGKVEINPDRYDAINELAKIATEYGDFALVIEGHTDSKGNDNKNLQLSESRAKAVMSYLATQGVAPGRMTAVGKGEGEPVAENTSKSGRAQNRRIEVLFASGKPAGG